MDRFRVVGGKRLKGEVEIGGAKNAVLPILAAALLTDETIVLEGCPALLDVRNMLEILKKLGCAVSQEGGRVEICAAGADCWEMPEELSKSLRSSIFMLGPLLGRFRRARVTYPGGCEIGLRPIDLHLKGLRALGVSVREEHGMIYCDGSRLRGAEVHLDFPSVGATENAMMAAVLARGRTTIHNAAREPEIRDLQDFINAMGGRISGGGTDTVVIEGVSALGGARYRPLADRIVAGTLLTAVGAAGGEAVLKGAPAGDMGAVIDKMRQTGCEVEVREDEIAICAQKRLRAVEISTQPYPGFPTDMQAQFMALACTLAAARQGNQREMGTACV